MSSALISPFKLPPSELETVALRLFKRGRDTKTIAQMLCVSEAEIYNALARATRESRAQ